LATAVGGPVAIIRISGPRALAVAGQVWQGRAPLSELPARELHLGRIIGEKGEVDTQALAVYMPGRRSFTGEDTVEIQCHGGVLGARLVLVRILDCGARHAEPGEFSKRAFLNGKLDLTQAEAVNDLILAQTEMALRLANRQLQGRLGHQLQQLYAELSELLAEMESRLDFPEEELDWLPEEEIQARLDRANRQIHLLLNSRRDGEVLRHGIRLVLAGPPNVGKSSLLNAFLGRDRAIVTHIPGTTRDTLEELAHIRGIPLRLIDTAGIRESSDPVEQSGIQRSHASMEESQIVLWVYDATLPYAEQACQPIPGNPAVILVANKLDQLDGAVPPADCAFPSVATSALTGQGLEQLFDEIERQVWERPHAAEPEVAVNARHGALLEKACAELDSVQLALETDAWELVAIPLRGALEAIGKITGQTASPDVLDTIFSKFCIGK
jgi:tRNA modification GTPase